MGKKPIGSSDQAADKNRRKPRSVRFEALRIIRGYLNSIDPNRIIKRLIRAAQEVFAVPSERFADVVYSVFVDPDGCWACTCADFRSYGAVSMCKHIIEVLFRFFPSIAPAAPNNEELAAFAKKWYEGARRYPHIPHTYDGGPAEATRDGHALEEEDQRVEELVLDLGRLVDRRFPLHAAPKRPTLSWGDRLIVRVLRLQHRKSIRKFKEFGKRLVRELKIAFSPSRGSQSKYFSEPQTLEKLRQGFVCTTDPFVEMDDDIVIDSSGVSPFLVSCWVESQYGTRNIRAGTQWFKVHIAIGRRSHAILGFIVTLNTGPGISDIGNFRPLLEGLYAHGFRPRRVIADNIYLTRKNIDAAQEIGAMLVGPLKPRNFRRDHTSSPEIVSIVDFRDEEPDVYDELCRARNIVEAVFSEEVRYYRNISSIGTREEREKVKLGDGDILFVSRLCEFWARAIRYNLARTANREHRWGQRIWYTRGGRFSYFPRQNADDEIYGKGA